MCTKPSLRQVNVIALMRNKQRPHNSTVIPLPTTQNRKLSLCQEDALFSENAAISFIRRDWRIWSISQSLSADHCA